VVQIVTPYLLYDDAAAALAFLERAFGFQEVMRMKAPDGRVNHAEMRRGAGHIHLGQPDHPMSPRRLGGTPVLIYVVVDDVDAHFAHARAEGAEIIDEPADQHYGERRYAARDPEGHVWYFASPLAA
jgi:PhnB protein